MDSLPLPETTPAETADRGARARQRLLAEASRLFAEKGYVKASTREICQAAQLNVAAIHYHFGGKDGLYREVLLAPIRAIAARLAGFDDPALALPDALRRLLGAFLPDAGGAGGGPDAEAMRLHLREMVEPSPGYAELIGASVRPQHEALAALLARHIGLPAPDDDVHRLAFALVAMAQDYAMSREFMLALAPRLLAGPESMRQVLDRLVDWGCALVEHERRRRASAGQDPTP